MHGDFLSRIGTMSGSSGPGLDPYRSWCILYEAARWTEGSIRDGRPKSCYSELVSEWGNIRELGETLAKKYKIPQITPEEILDEINWWRWKWQRVNELKDIEAGLRDMPMTPKSRIIHFSPKAYAFHVEVTEYRSYITLEFSVIVLTYFRLILLISSTGPPTHSFSTKRSLILVGWKFFLALVLMGVHRILFTLMQ